MEALSSEENFSDDVLQVVDIRNVGSFLSVDDEIDIFNMTSLSSLLLFGHTSKSVEDSYEEDDKLQRLSLAYEKLHTIPKILIQELSHSIKILDISNNEFKNLDFLAEFKNLTTLICDHNKITETTSIPYMPTLELLWMNHCKIASLYPWAKKLQLACPNLRYLSLMGNPVTPCYLDGGNFYEYLQYRLFIISLFENLVHLDDKPVTDDQRKEAERMYHRPLLERLVMKSQASLPYYLRQVSDSVSEMLMPKPAFAESERNVIV